MTDPKAVPEVLPGAEIRAFVPEDLAELVVLQRGCWVQEALLNETLDVPALREQPDEVLRWATGWTTLVVRHEGRLIAAVRGRQEEGEWHIGRLMVAPDLAGKGIGSWLLGRIEARAPDDVRRFVLFTGGRSVRNIRTYQRAGYRVVPVAEVPAGHIAGAVQMVKPKRA